MALIGIKRLFPALLIAISAGLAGLSSSAHAHAAETVSLGSLDISKVDQDWGEPQVDQSVERHPLSIGGKKFERGLGTHAESTFSIDLKGDAQRFTAYVGVDDEVGKSQGSVEFRVLADNRELWKSGVMTSGQAPKMVDVNLKGFKKLLLLVNDAGDGISYDHADWADAKIEYAAQRPEVIGQPAESPVILTPKPQPTPRINGAKLFGVRPGAPFMYSIAATGLRPMTFAADDLPEGLTLDPQTGRITGELQKPGQYIVTLRAENSMGKAQRKFKIICGETIALTPPMGWNSWNCFAHEVDDAKVHSAADAMVQSGLANHGWTYINIDDCWEIKPGSNDPKLQGPPRDENGMINSNKKFPDMKALCDYIHSKGLKAGIYSSPGPLTCAGFTASYKYEEKDAQRYAQWGFDYLKYDWCSYGKIAGKNPDLPAMKKPYQVMREALDGVHRDIVFSLCQYGMGDVWKWGAEVGGNSWRTTGDITDTWSSLSKIGFSQAGHEQYAAPGHWNDPDMLVVGKVGWGKLHPTKLTPNEQYTHISLWCLLCSPLLIGCDMTQLDQFTLNLLTNDEVLDVNQDPLGKQARRVIQADNLEIWAKPLEDGSTAVGFFNRGESEKTITVNFPDLDLSGRQMVRDLWRQKDLGAFDNQFTANVARHDVVLVRMGPAAKTAEQAAGKPVKPHDANEKNTQAVQDYPIKPVPFTAVHLNDVFWAPRIEINRTVTIPFAFEQCEKSGRMDNFDRAAASLRGEELKNKQPPGLPFDDTDPYKVLEGASYALAIKPDPKMKEYLDDLIAKIGAAQEPDGYLYTARTIDPEHPHSWSGPKRWLRDPEQSHELYNAGHLFEAAAAHFQATGQRNLLDIAVKEANLLCETFGPDKLHIWPGHEIVEMGLVKLYRATGDRRYLDLAKFFLDVRGPGGDQYHQSHVKPVDQTKALGHAVRAGYLYSGMADVAAMTGDRRYLHAIDAIWEDVVTKKLYITGGIGALGKGEAFGADYQLPNLSAYCETCAAIANDYWNLRLFLLHGDAKYIDVMERTLYNGLLSGVSLDGKLFFYPNPLESNGRHKRSPWFGCACCPGNMTRFLASVPGYVYAQRRNEIYVNLYAAGTADVKLDDGRTVKITQETRYPWDGAVKIKVEPDKPGPFTISLRIPGWARDEAVPGDLYKFMDKAKEPATIKVKADGVTRVIPPLHTNEGYVPMAKSWQRGDEIELNLPMPVRRILANDKVADDAGKVALQRGPLVYCIEWPDVPNGHVLNLLLPDEAPLSAEFRPDLLGGVVILKGEAMSLQSTEDHKIDKEKVDFIAIPYYAWANRGSGQMAVWLPRQQSAAQPLPYSAAATANKISSILP